MKVAVTHENGQVFQHFGHTAEFKLYDIENGTVSGGRICPTLGSGHGALADFLKELGVEVLICGGIGQGAKMALAEAGIRLYGGVSGSADEAAKAFAESRLSFDPNVACSHHDHGDNHTCGRHCGSQD